jgi:hypothetical protein
MARGTKEARSRTFRWEIALVAEHRVRHEAEDGGGVAGAQRQRRHALPPCNVQRQQVRVGDQARDVVPGSRRLQQGLEAFLGTAPRRSGSRLVCVL